MGNEDDDKVVPDFDNEQESPFRVIKRANESIEGIQAANSRQIGESRDFSESADTDEDAGGD